VVLCHGWPQLSYSWRHQIKAPRKPDFMWSRRTCGGSAGPAPPHISACSIFDTVGDMMALGAALGERNAVIIGHDWGAPVAWFAALFRPDLFTAVAGLSVPPPFRGRAARPLDSLRTSGISNFLLAVFQKRDFGLSMKILLGRGFSEGPGYLFSEPGEGFLADVRLDRLPPVWLSKADLGFSPRPTKGPASVEGSTGTAISTRPDEVNAALIAFLRENAAQAVTLPTLSPQAASRWLHGRVFLARTGARPAFQGRGGFRLKTL
jgi:pimeloyl-ACP methyl ester carboxylesterase